MMSRLLTIIIIIIINTTTLSEASFCLNPLGQPVDWFIIYKLPRLSHNPRSTGAEQLYMDAGRESWRRLDVSITEKRGHPFADTFNQLGRQEAEGTSLYVMYNDEVPVGGDGGWSIKRGKGGDFGGKKKVNMGGRNGWEHRLGHTKGILHSNTTSGFWLIHSVPLFPSTSQSHFHHNSTYPLTILNSTHYPPTSTISYNYPHTGLMFGQSILCISLPYNQLDLVGKQLTFNEPIVFRSVLPMSMALQNPSLASVLKGKFNHEAPFSSTVRLKSVGGKEFVSFAKKDTYGKDLYSGLVAKELDISLLVEGWRNGAGNLPSFCDGKYKVENVMEVRVGAFSFETSKDHSKWVVSNNKNNNKTNGSDDEDGDKDEGVTKHYVCIGDINRQHGQLSRGGGTVCMTNKNVWKAYMSMVIDREACPKTTPTHYVFTNSSVALNYILKTSSEYIWKYRSFANSSNEPHYVLKSETIHYPSKGIVHIHQTNYVLDFSDYYLCVVVFILGMTLLCLGSKKDNYKIKKIHEVVKV